MRISFVKSALLLLVAASSVESFEGGFRGQSEQQEEQEEKEITDVRVSTNEIDGEQQEQHRLLGDDGSSYSDPIMFILRNGEEGSGEYCLTYETMDTIVHPDKENEPILGLVASRCSAGDKKQHWIMDTSRTRAPIRPREDLSLCIDNFENRLGSNSARLMKCAMGKDVVQRMKIATAEVVKGAIQTYGSDGWGRSLALDYYSRGGDQYIIKFDRIDVAMWDQVDPNDYEGPTSSGSCWLDERVTYCKQRCDRDHAGGSNYDEKIECRSECHGHLCAPCDWTHDDVKNCKKYCDRTYAGGKNYSDRIECRDECQDHLGYC